MSINTKIMWIDDSIRFLYKKQVCGLNMELELDTWN